MEIVPLPKYQDIFPGVGVPELGVLLGNVPSNFALNVICFINAKIYVNQLNFETQRNIFLTMIGRMPQDNQKEIIKNFDLFIEGLSNYQFKHFSIFALVALLRFAEYEILNYRPGEFENVSPEGELNVLKAILIFNGILDDELSNTVANRYQGPYTYPNENFYRIAWPNMIRQYEFNFLKDILKQIYLSILFLEYLDNHNRFKTYFKSYVGKSKITDFKDYIKKLVELHIFSYKMGEGEYHARFKPGLVDKNSVIQEFIIEPHKLDREAYLANNKNCNFKGLRKWPIVRFEDGYFAIINWNFITDKLFQAFVFDFYNNSGIASEKYKIGDFFSDIGNQFAHKEVFEDILDKIFFDKGVCLKDQKNELINYDYYFRKDNKIIIFEFKNILLPYKEVYEDILEDIDKKMIIETHKGKSQNKAVLQLLEHIDKIHNRYQEIDDFENDGIEKSRIIIYPVIVYTHEMWGIPGINDYLAERFAMEYRQKKYGFFMVRELIMMDFDHFLDCYDSLCSGDITIFQLLEKYYGDLALNRASSQKTGSSTDRMKTFRTFDEAVSTIKHKRCGFFRSSLYHELVKKLETPEG